MDRDFRVVVAGAADPDLVNEIMALIGRYCKTHGVVPCPVELRDTMLAVAALSHLEAEKFDCTTVSVCGEDFAEAARASFRDVTGVLATPVVCRQSAPRVRH